MSAQNHNPGRELVFLLKIRLLLSQAIQKIWKKRPTESHRKMTLAPMEENLRQSNHQSLSATQWPVGKTNDEHTEKEMVTVEVELYEKSRVSSCNHYTVEGEDPNLRITHYPPSNRIH